MSDKDCCGYNAHEAFEKKRLMMDPELGKGLGDALLVAKNNAINRLLKIILFSSMALIFFCLWLLFVVCCDFGSSSGPDYLMDDNPLVVVVSIDGMRFDMLKRGLTPNLERMASIGAMAPLQPQFPANTFPNHFSMVTGMVPARHGIVGNVFFDPSTQSVFAFDNSTLVRESKWWKAQPIWNVVQKFGLRSASVFWPGSEAEIGGRRPNIYYRYSESWSNAKRINKVIEIATLKNRPNLITAYLSSLDELGHEFGPFSAQVKDELIHIDALIGHLKRVIVDELHGTILVVSDHGMVDLPSNQHLLLSDWLPNYSERTVFVDFGAVCSIIPKKEHLDSVLEDLKFGESIGAPFRVYTTETLPTEWNYFNNDRIAPIIIQCDKGWTIDRAAKSSPLMGQHGYDPRLAEMRALFVGVGKNIKHVNLDMPFPNIDIYPLLSLLLNVPIDEVRDGSMALSSAVLASNK